MLKKHNKIPIIGLKFIFAMPEKQNILILILAAGESSRMGKHIKQLLPWKNTTLLGNAIHQAKASIASTTIVVLGAYQEEIKAKLGIEASMIVSNTNWKNGLGSSLAAGIAHFVSHPNSYDAVLICLADQPFIDTNYLNEMMAVWTENPSKIITTQYKKRSGVPAIFGKEYFLELAKLNKDFGAKDIIASHKDVILALDSEGKEIDIDSWETYKEYFN